MVYSQRWRGSQRHRSFLRSELRNRAPCIRQIGAGEPVFRAFRFIIPAECASSRCRDLRWAVCNRALQPRWNVTRDNDGI